MRKLKVEREKLPPQKIQFDDEREVVIQYDRLSDYATIWSADRTETAKFKKTGAEVIEQTKFGTKFRIEKSKININAAKRVSRTRRKKTETSTNTALF